MFLHFKVRNKLYANSLVVMDYQIKVQGEFQYLKSRLRFISGSGNIDRERAQKGQGFSRTNVKIFSISCATFSESTT